MDSKQTIFDIYFKKGYRYLIASRGFTSSLESFLARLESSKLSPKAGDLASALGFLLLVKHPFSSLLASLLE